MYDRFFPLQGNSDFSVAIETKQPIGLEDIPVVGILHTSTLTSSRNECILLSLLGPI